MVAKSENHKKGFSESGFTIVELLIVVVVIAILAAITIVSFNGITTRAKQSHAESGMRALEQAILVGRERGSKTLREITGRGYTTDSCYSLPSGTDLASLPASHSCWQHYLSALDKISDASGLDIRGLVDPWGRPYSIDENEGESAANPCAKDTLAVYRYPHEYQRTYVRTSMYPWREIAPSGLVAC